MVTIILYIILPILCLFGITYMLSSAIVLLLLIILRKPMTVMMISGCITWIIISILWHWIDGRTMPVLAYLIGGFALFIYGSINREKLNEGAKTILVFEIVGAVSIGIISATMSSPIRFF